MQRWLPSLAVGLLLGASAQATVVLLDTDPFAGSTALATPGRQIVGGEPVVSFNPATDQFQIGHGFGLAAYAPGLGSLGFANDLITGIPASGANFVVLRSFDNDGNAATPFGAGNAATLLAGQITTPGAGFFIYFNSALDLPRLVFSTDLDDPTADLKILARMSNLGGAAGRAALADFSAANVALVAEPPALALVLAAGALMAGLRRRSRGR